MWILDMEEGGRDRGGSVWISQISKLLHKPYLDKRGKGSKLSKNCPHGLLVYNWPFMQLFVFLHKCMFVIFSIYVHVANICRFSTKIAINLRGKYFPLSCKIPYGIVFECRAFSEKF